MMTTKATNLAAYPLATVPAYSKTERFKQSLLDALDFPVNSMKKSMIKPAFNPFFEANKERLKGKTIWIDGQAWKVMDINKDGALQLKKKGEKNEKAEFRAISSFGMLKKMGQVNGMPDQNTTNGNTYTLSRKEAQLHALLQELFREEGKFLGESAEIVEEPLENTEEVVENKEELEEVVIFDDSDF